MSLGREHGAHGSVDQHRTHQARAARERDCVLCPGGCAADFACSAGSCRNFVDVDDNIGIATKYDILSIPTVMVFEGGQMQKKLIGALPRRRIEDELSTWLGASSGA